MSNLNERTYLQLSQKGEVKHESTKKYVRLCLKVLLREDDVYTDFNTENFRNNEKSKSGKPNSSTIELALCSFTMPAG